MPGVGCFSHCAADGVAITDSTIARATVFMSASSVTASSASRARPTALSFAPLALSIARRQPSRKDLANAAGILFEDRDDERTC
jgi:hypothetical protein